MVGIANDRSWGLDSDGEVHLWGQLSDLPNTPAGPFVDMACQAATCCAQRPDDSLTCWGEADPSTLTPPVGLEVIDFTVIWAGDADLICALSVEHLVLCWGPGGGSLTDVPESLSPVCGNAVIEPGETCETCEADCGACPDPCGDGACETDETCETCPIDCGECPLVSDGLDCAEIHALNPDWGDGVYTIDPDDDGPITPFQVHCDMTTEGGGWTGLTFPMVDAHLTGVMVAEDAAHFSGIDPVHGPWAWVEVGGYSTFTYHYTFDFVPGWSEIYVGEDYRFAVYAEAEIGQLKDDPACSQQVWTCGHQCGSGDGAGEGCLTDCSHSVGSISIGTEEAPIVKASDYLGDGVFINYVAGEAHPWP
ncbi:MAG: fibrinogen-like YCDxxxxGGGW domain-containing protein, partial [Myxococcota bacterium]|nr:fibrinogen-like YCDxxxxGGGW domain-containing protein [Myxococcota bacterium]